MRLAPSQVTAADRTRQLHALVGSARTLPLRLHLGRPVCSGPGKAARPKSKNARGGQELHPGEKAEAL